MKRKTHDPRALDIAGKGNWHASMMSDAEGTGRNGTPKDGVADAGASPAGSGSVAEGSTAGAGSRGSGAASPASGAASPGSAANPLSATEACRENVIYDHRTATAMVFAYRVIVPCKCPDL